MAEKPRTAAGYGSDVSAAVRATCLYVATKLGDLMDDLVVVGGLAPSLLIDQDVLADGMEPHVGTLDLDVGLTVALLDDGRYQTLTERLRGAGFSQDVNDKGNLTRQTWKIEHLKKVTVDFLIEPSLPGDRGGSLRNIESDFAAVIAPGLHLAFEDRRKVTLSGPTIKGEHATRDVWVCGAGAFVILKALAFSLRGENKDAYDLYYVIRNYGTGIDDVASSVRPLLGDDATHEAFDVLRRDFLEHDGIGARRVAEFLGGGPETSVQADVVGHVDALIRAVGGDTG